MTPALFVGGVYDGAVISLAPGLGVVYGLGPDGSSYAYLPTRLTLHGRKVRAYVCTAPPTPEAVARATLTRDAYLLWAAAAEPDRAATAGLS